MDHCGVWAHEHGRSTEFCPIAACHNFRRHNALSICRLCTLTLHERVTLSSRDVFTTTGLIQLRICTSIHTYLSVNIEEIQKLFWGILVDRYVIPQHHAK